jgi:dihydrofolate reductase
VRKLFAFLMTSTDGYHEGPQGEFDWPVVDEEFGEFAARQLDDADTLLFGRRTYETMAAYWPTSAAREADPDVARQMNDYQKVVVSGTLTQPRWAPTRVVRGALAEEIADLKGRPGKDIALLGSSQLTTGLLDAGLVDELRIMVSPVVLGAGRSALAGTPRRTSLTLSSTQAFASGNVLLVYRPAVHPRA